MQVLLKPGDLVRVRGRRWRIREIRDHGTCQTVTLDEIAGRDLGTRRSLLAPFDVVEPIRARPRLRIVSSQRWRHACRARLLDNTPPGALRSGLGARMDLFPHQLEPALAVVRGLASRVLLADEVGLGKTVQAGLIVSELTTRGAADRVLILTPAGLRDQWAQELADRFGIEAAAIDARAIRKRQAELPVGTNPWVTLPIAIASIDYVKRPEILASVRRCRWDVLAIDEAHNVAGESDRHEASAILADRAAYVMLLSATPHSGDRAAFESLCRLGAHEDALLMFRRTRADVRLAAPRRIRVLHLRPNAAERRMHALVARLTAAARESARGETAADRRMGDSALLALTVINKRALSSAWSLARTIERRLSETRGQFDDTSSDQMLLPLDLYEEDDSADKSPALSPMLRDERRERALLEELGDAARVAAAGGETKICALVRLLRRVREPAIVFTEYRDTLLHVHDALGGTAALLHGGLARGERSRAIAEFTSGGRKLLLATDAAGEGLNLHHTCRLVITLELPWNPMRLEQRIGRVDRIGQRRTVHAVHLVARDTPETALLDRLRTRLERARAEAGAANPLESVDEREMARRIFEPAGARTSGTETDDSLVRIDLAADGAAEASRLGILRRLVRGTPRRATLDQDDAIWIAVARTPGTRRALCGKALLISRVSAGDLAGRTTETLLVAGQIVWPYHERDIHLMSGIETFLDRAAALLEATAAPAIAAWADAAAAFTDGFFTRRIAREKAIASAASSSSAPSVQRGLFDRRADVGWARDAALAEAADKAATRQIAELERASTLTVGRPSLVLVLAPTR